MYAYTTFYLSILGMTRFLRALESSRTENLYREAIWVTILFIFVIVMVYGEFTMY